MHLNFFHGVFLSFIFTGGFPGGMPGGMPGMAGMPGLNEILSDPEVLAAMQVRTCSDKTYICRMRTQHMLSCHLQGEEKGVKSFLSKLSGYFP